MFIFWGSSNRHMSQGCRVSLQKMKDHAYLMMCERLLHSANLSLESFDQLESISTPGELASHQGNGFSPPGQSNCNSQNLLENKFLLS
jgi:hypothetical protein